MFPAWCEASNATEPRVRNATQFPQKLIGPMSQLGQKRKSWPSSWTSASPPITDMQRSVPHVRFVPEDDIARLSACGSSREAMSLASADYHGGGSMRRRSFIAGLGSAAAWPLAVPPLFERNALEKRRKLKGCVRLL